MKPQDIIFIITLLVLVIFRKSNYFVFAGIFSLLVAIPLFANQIFFSAQHLTYYAVGFFFVAVVYKLIELRKRN